MTVWRVLKKHQVKAVVKQRKKSDYIRYSKEVSGERVQLDVMKVRNGAYQFTAIDDCTRLRTIRVYPNKKAESTIHFLGEILNTFPFLFPFSGYKLIGEQNFSIMTSNMNCMTILSNSGQSNQGLRI